MTEKKAGKKRAWIKPEIKALVRSESQETVLASCKEHWSISGGPGDINCQSGGWSYVCSEQGAS
ncbi:MAG: hypothetical protein R6X08_13105 [Desulfosalsimonadaceae bacterium]